MDEAKAANLRIMTWNIHGGGPTRRNRDLRRVVALVERHRPDIVALQEIDARGAADPAMPPFEFLANALGSHAAEARLILAADGEAGHALISRFPLRDILRHDVSLAGREPRAAIEATVETPGGPLHVVAAHLGLSFRERRHQAAHLAKVARAGPPNSVVLGDFNDWVWHGSVQQALAACMGSRTRLRTFPAWLPTLTLDRVYCRPAGLLVRAWTDTEARRASDHLPVIADLALAGSGAEVMP
jgi:endonuclease/exonuclease/phosphatase family metal-dependent hydrolase